MNSKTNSFSIQLLIGAIFVGYVVVAFFFSSFLHYDFFRSDVLSYWQDSISWKTPFHPFHVPGYPLIIAFIRGITFNAFPPVGLMMGINLIALLASAFLVYRILQESGSSDDVAAIGVFLFSLYPFVGLTYTVTPLADMPAMFLFLLGLNLIQRSFRIPGALFLGLSLVTHKAMWVFVGLLVIFDFMQRKEYVSKRNFFFIGLTLLPIGILFILGSFYHNSLTWLFSSNLEVEVASKSNSILLDGLLGTLNENGLKGLVKGILLLTFAIISTIALYLSYRLRYKYFHYGIAISLAILFLFLILNQHEIWAAMRFGRLSAIPLALIANRNNAFNNKPWFRKFAIIVLPVLLLLSQFAYAWYMARVYFA